VTPATSAPARGAGRAVAALVVLGFLAAAIVAWLLTR
jgi:hypothetical protein